MLAVISIISEFTKREMLGYGLLMGITIGVIIWIMLSIAEHKNN